MKLGKTLIIGDSYSTFEGYIPSTYDCWYSVSAGEKTDVTAVEKTWWHQVFSEKGNSLIKNDSFSGSSICNTVWPDLTPESSFVSRFDKLKKEGFFADNQIDTVIVFGYTNDFWINVPFGEAKYSGFKNEDLFEFCPAVCYLASGINETVPDANVLWVLNCDVDEKFQNAIKSAAEHFGQRCLILKNIDKLSDHPSAKGMTQIANAVKNF